MNPRERSVWACAVCGTCYGGTCHASDGEALAATCCTCRSCGAPTVREYRCAACTAADNAAVEQAAYEKAKKVPLAEYSGWVCQGGIYIDADDEDALRDRIRGGWAWACDENRATFDLFEGIHLHVHDNHHDHAFDFVDEAALEKAQALVDEALRNVVSYDGGRDIVVLMPPEWEKDKAG